MAAGAAIGGDDQIDLMGACILRNMPGLDTITFHDSVGNVIGNIGTDVSQKIQQDNHRGNAVNIIVAKDQDFFMVDNCFENAIDRRLHILQRKGRA